eukprot:5418663-Karenia_brevis.AAC.1
MDNLECLDYLDGKPALLGVHGWTTFTAWITWMGDLYCLDYQDGNTSLPGVHGWTTTCTA